MDSPVATQASPGSPPTAEQARSKHQGKVVADSGTRRWELIQLLARKEWRIRYRSAKLGYAWAVVQPLMLMLVLLVVFGLSVVFHFHQSITPQLVVAHA